jgi:UDP-N-acetylmuramyl pentapeptide phosphotransferase/UDP-N-acetylglucosamine-1-phosphate transferase
VSQAFSHVASLLAGFLGGVMAFVLVVEGYMYLAAMDDVQKAAHAKRAIGAAIVGGILVVVATTGLATDLVNAFNGK